MGTHTLSSKFEGQALDSSMQLTQRSDLSAELSQELLAGCLAKLAVALCRTALFGFRSVTVRALTILSLLAVQPESRQHPWDLA